MLRTLLFLSILLGSPALDLVWWRWADVRLRRLRRAGLWRAALGGFVLFEFFGFTWLLLSRVGGVHLFLPSAMLVVIYLWHLLVLPVTMLGLLAWAVGRGAARAAGWALSLGNSPRGSHLRPALGAEDLAALTGAHQGSGAGEDASQCTGEQLEEAALRRMSRREMLGATAVALPPLLMGGRHASRPGAARRAARALN